MKNHLLSVLAIILCLAASTPGWGQYEFMAKPSLKTDLQLKDLKETPYSKLVDSAMLSGDPFGVRRKELIHELDLFARDITVVMQNSRKLEREARQRETDALIAKYPVVAPTPSQKKVGLLERFSVKRIFGNLRKKLFTSEKTIEVSPEQTQTDIVAMKQFGAQKIKVIKAVRTLKAVNLARQNLEQQKVELMRKTPKLFKEAFDLVPNDAKIRAGGAGLDIALLGSIHTAWTALRLARADVALGFKGFETAPQCRNVILTESKDDGSFELPYLSRYYKEVAGRNKGPTETDEKTRIARARWFMAKIQEGLNCLSLRDGSAVDTQIARSGIQVSFLLWASGKGLAARALIDSYLPVSVLVLEAVKSSKKSQNLYLFLLDADYRSLTEGDGSSFDIFSLHLADREDGGLDVTIGDRVVSSFPPLTEDILASDNDLLKLLLVDNEAKSTLKWVDLQAPFHPFEAGTPLTTVDRHGRSYLDILRSFLDFRALGEGLCSLHEMTANNLICRKNGAACRALANLASGMPPTTVGRVGGATGAYFAGFSTRPGGSWSPDSHLDVPRAEYAGDCGGGAGAAAGGIAPTPASANCVVPTGFRVGGAGTTMTREQEKLLSCTGNFVTEEGQHPPLQIGGGNFGCRIGIAMQEGEASGVRRGEADGARSQLRDQYFNSDGSATERGRTLGGAIAEAINGTYEGANIDWQSALDLYGMGLEVAVQKWADGDLELDDPRQDQTVPIHTEALRQAVLNFGSLWPRTETAGREQPRPAGETSGGEHAGRDLGDPSTGGAADALGDPSGEEWLDDPFFDEPSGTQQCDLAGGGDCTASCSPADEMIRNFKESCLTPPIESIGQEICNYAPDRCSSMPVGGEPPPAQIDLLAGCVATPPSVSSAYSGCINVLCGTDDPNCCGGGGEGGGGSGAPIPTTIGPGGRPLGPGIEPVAPSLFGPGGVGGPGPLPPAQGPDEP